MPKKVYPEKLFNDLPDATAVFYHECPEDIRIMRDLGIKLFRFSVS